MVRALAGVGRGVTMVGERAGVARRVTRVRELAGIGTRANAGAGAGAPGTAAATIAGMTDMTGRRRLASPAAGAGARAGTGAGNHPGRAVVVATGGDRRNGSPTNETGK